MARRTTLRLSIQGRQQAEQARIERGWTKLDDRPCREVSKIIQPGHNWDDPHSPPYVSPKTWQRFLGGEDRIQTDSFMAFCKILDLDWKSVVEPEIFSAPKPIVARDLSEAADITSLYGREPILAMLQTRVVSDHCRLIGIYGQGGIGKTALARQLIERVKDHYDCVVWRSLESAPFLSDILGTTLQFLTGRAIATGDTSQLIEQFRQKKCLLILDDWESILGFPRYLNRYADGYRDYGELLRRIATEPHPSCMIILSRAKPIELESLSAGVSTLYKLGNVSPEDSRQILMTHGLRGKEEYLNKLGDRYGNPKLLQLLAQHIHDAARGYVDEVMMEASTFVSDAMADFFYEQFRCLSSAEKSLIYWIVIRRNTATLSQLRQDTKLYLSASELTHVLSVLRGGRGLVEINEENDTYYINEVALKYLTIQFVEEVCQDLLRALQTQQVTGSELFVTHSFITSDITSDVMSDKALDSTPTELQDEQYRRFVKPIKGELSSTFSRKWSDAVAALETLRDKLETLASEINHHAIQNILYLLQ